jgi:hypothetical protein
MRTMRAIVPERTDHTDWRTPRTTDAIETALARVPRNGEWWVLRKGLGMTVSEQQARALNATGGPWVFGYRVYADGGDLRSDLAVRWTGR